VEAAVEVGVAVMEVAAAVEVAVAAAVAVAVMEVAAAVEVAVAAEVEVAVAAAVEGMLQSKWIEWTRKAGSP
jgi:hypothetical protein